MSIFPNKIDPTIAVVEVIKVIVKSKVKDGIDTLKVMCKKKISKSQKRKWHICLTLKKLIMSEKLTDKEIIQAVGEAGKELASVGEKLSDLFCNLVDKIFGK